MSDPSSDPGIRDLCLVLFVLNYLITSLFSGMFCSRFASEFVLKQLTLTVFLSVPFLRLSGP